MRRAAVTAVVLGLAAAAPAVSQERSWLEKWLFNPEERTVKALESASRGELGEVVEPLEAALRLSEGSPVARYNTGTALLMSEESGALALLRSAAEHEDAGDDLLADTFYNLGNAKMKDEELAGAIAAYKEALRHAPDFADAKFNLELAQRRLEQQQESDEPQDDEQEEQEQEQEQQEQEQQEQEPEGQPPPEDPGPQDEDQDQGEQQKESPLPQFRDLPDMSAEEAAAILEAIENMERERRREEALEAARANSGGKKDW